MNAKDVLKKAGVREEYTVEKCDCGHPGCNKYGIKELSIPNNSLYENEAHLIAAAPKLAEALITLLQESINNDFIMFDRRYGNNETVLQIYERALKVNSDEIAVLEEALGMTWEEMQDEKRD